ncbi:MAG: DUF2071 domain-containing protein, partial [Gloeobacteraceae cyanobacterium ES-bin-316]|nr:DUF2071 domain-containing protein [Ferruginibacter sp.]
MANYVVDPALLQPYLPYKTQLENFHGKIYLSLVGLQFFNTKVLGRSIPWHQNFEEVNLRFYVQPATGNLEETGVVFIKEIVRKPAITFIANKLYREKYSTMPMAHELKTVDEIALNYTWKFKNKWNKMQVTAQTETEAMQPGSEEDFIANHYYGYSKYNEHTTFQ